MAFEVFLVGVDDANVKEKVKADFAWVSPRGSLEFSNKQGDNKFAAELVAAYGPGMWVYFKKIGV